MGSGARLRTQSWQLHLYRVTSPDAAVTPCTLQDWPLHASEVIKTYSPTTTGAIQSVKGRAAEQPPHSRGRETRKDEKCLVGTDLHECIECHRNELQLSRRLQHITTASRGIDMARYRRRPSSSRGRLCECRRQGWRRHGTCILPRGRSSTR